MRSIVILLAFLTALFTVPAVAGQKITINADGSVSAYSGKKDKAYWTRVWYAKHAKKDRRARRRGKVVRKKSSRKRKKVASKRSRKYSSKAAYAPSKSRKKSRRRGGGRVHAKIDLSLQRMNVYRGKSLLYTWKVSTGRAGYGTPTGSWTIKRMHREYYSKKYDNAPMPYAMFYRGGFAVHGTNSIKRLGRPASHGCVRLHPSNAATLFSMVKRHGGRVTVKY